MILLLYKNGHIPALVFLALLAPRAWLILTIHQSIQQFIDDDYEPMKARVRAVI